MKFEIKVIFLGKQFNVKIEATDYAEAVQKIKDSLDFVAINKVDESLPHSESNTYYGNPDIFENLKHILNIQ